MLSYLGDAENAGAVLALRTPVIRGIRHADHWQIGLGGEDPDDIKLEYFLPPEVAYRIRFRVDTDWRTPVGDVWSFQPAGLCEPLVVQFTRAEAWIELEFDPLTGSVTREEFHLP